MLKIQKINFILQNILKTYMQSMEEFLVCSHFDSLAFVPFTEIVLIPVTGGLKNRTINLDPITITTVAHITTVALLTKD